MIGPFVFEDIYLANMEAQSEGEPGGPGEDDNDLPGGPLGNSNN